MKKISKRQFHLFMTFLWAVPIAVINSIGWLVWDLPFWKSIVIAFMLAFSVWSMLTNWSEVVKSDN